MPEQILEFIENQIFHLIADENEGDLSSIKIAAKEIRSIFPGDIQQDVQYVLNKLVLDGMLIRSFLTTMENDVDTNDFYFTPTEKGIQRTKEFFEVSDSRNQLIDRIENIILTFETSSLNEASKRNYILTLDEIRRCYLNKCFNAAIALCGKIIEVYLREVLYYFNVPIELSYDDKKTGKRTVITDLTLGQLYKLTNNIKDREKFLYIEPNTIELIKSFRNGVIHFSEKIPVPSEEQTEAIILFIIDIMNRRMNYMW